MAPQAKRPPPEYIEKLTSLHTVWSRNNEEANRMVFADLDIMLDNAVKDAFDKGYFEAYAHLDMLRAHIKIGFAENLKKELDYVKKLEP